MTKMGSESRMNWCDSGTALWAEWVTFIAGAETYECGV